MLLTASAAVAAVVALAAPAQADPWIDDQVDDHFVTLLEERGFNVSHDLQASRALGAYARSICNAVDSGISYEDLMASVRGDNPTFTEMQSVVFTGVAMNTYCPPR
jgi:hypothetical protein